MLPRQEMKTSEQRYLEAREKHALKKESERRDEKPERRDEKPERRDQGKEQKVKPKRNKDKYNKNKERNAALKKIKNTESFDPVYENQTDLRIVLHSANDANVDNAANADNASSFNQTLSQKDVLIVPNLFKDFFEGELYKRLLDEINTCGTTSIFKLWHGDSHLIADDHLDWKTKCPTFNMVISRIQSYFNMDIKATRFNYYPDSSTFKPFHFDASAVKPEKAKIQNFTLAISFGATRDAAFEHATTKTIISLPQTDGYIYAFCKDINITWRHGILKKGRADSAEGAGAEGAGGEGEGAGSDGRISIICWGWLDQTKT
jgi:hypothetical protein